ncbi:hypothetical protein GCM10009412_05270 [Aeromonas salmonicida subsp. achromogenes]
MTLRYSSNCCKETKRTEQAVLQENKEANPRVGLFHGHKAALFVLQLLTGALLPKSASKS